MNTNQISINGQSYDITTVEARQRALEAAIQAHMKEQGLDRGAAFDRVRRDPQLKDLFDAMRSADPFTKFAQGAMNLQ